jgi:hypothetical protein
MQQFDKREHTPMAAEARDETLFSPIKLSRHKHELKITLIQERERN